MASFVIGKDSTWVELAVRPPVDTTLEPIQTISQSLGGVSTVNRVAVKNRWTLNLVIGASTTQVYGLYLASPGPYFFWSGSPAPKPYTGDGWRVVLIEALVLTSYSAGAHAGVLTLREV